MSYKPLLPHSFNQNATFSTAAKLTHARYGTSSPPANFDRIQNTISLARMISEFVTFYNHNRAHMERDHLPPVREEPEQVETLTMDQIEVKSYVAGLVTSFERKAP
jgi:hypothetical protein